MTCIDAGAMGKLLNSIDSMSQSCCGQVLEIDCYNRQVVECNTEHSGWPCWYEQCQYLMLECQLHPLDSMLPTEAIQLVVMLVMAKNKKNSSFYMLSL